MDLKKVLEEGELKTDKKFTPLLLGDGKNAEELRILKQIGFKEDIETGFIAFLGTMLVITGLLAIVIADK